MKYHKKQQINILAIGAEKKRPAGAKTTPTITSGNSKANDNAVHIQ